MPEWWSLFVGPAAPTIGRLNRRRHHGCNYLLFRLKRKRVLFIVGKTESLTDALKAKGGDNVKVSINKQELDTLNRAEVLAINKILQYRIVVLRSCWMASIRGSLQA